MDGTTVHATVYLQTQSNNKYWYSTNRKAKKQLSVRHNIRFADTGKLALNTETFTNDREIIKNSHFLSKRST